VDIGVIARVVTQERIAGNEVELPKKREEETLKGKPSAHKLDAKRKGGKKRGGRSKPKKASSACEDRSAHQRNRVNAYGGKKNRRERT